MTTQPAQTTDTQPPAENDPSWQTKSSKRTKWIILFSLLLLIVGTAWFGMWHFYWQFEESTDDAYGNGSIVNVNAPVDGFVIAFYADDTDFVKEGQLLVELDPTYYVVAYQQALAELAAQVLQLRQLHDEKLASEANVLSKQALLSKTRFDYENRSKLAASKAISNEDYIHARDDLTVAEAELKKAQYQLQSASDILGTTPLENHPLLDAKKASVQQAYYNWKHCKIYAPTSGYIAKRSVNVGQGVSRHSDLMAIIPTDYVWVDANFKETQLTNMRVGQPATVWFDIYGSEVQYAGKVLGIASGSGSVFSLIPPQNATGNWIKIVQRLPVRISLDADTVKKYPVRLGTSAEVRVDISDRSLPMLTHTVTTKPVTTTSVFDIHLDEVNRIINQVIYSAMQPLEQSQRLP